MVAVAHGLSGIAGIGQLSRDRHPAYSGHSRDPRASGNPGVRERRVLTDAGVPSPSAVPEAAGSDSGARPPRSSPPASRNAGGTPRRGYAGRYGSAPGPRARPNGKAAGKWSRVGGCVPVRSSPRTPVESLQSELRPVRIAEKSGHETVFRGFSGDRGVGKMLDWQRDMPIMSLIPLQSTQSCGGISDCPDGSLIRCPCHA